MLLALTMGLIACRDRAEDVTGGAWFGTPISQMPTGAVVDALQPSPDTTVSAPTAADEVAEPGGDDNALRLEAETLASQGDHVGAIAAARRLLGRQPKSAAAAIFYGKQLQRAQRLPEAADAFAQALRRAPDDTDALYGHAVTLVQMGNIDDAKASIRALAERRPADPDVKALLRRSGIAAPAGGE